MRFILIGIFFLSTSAQAATSSAWKALDTAARTRCEQEIVRLASKAKVGTIAGRVSGIGAMEDRDRFYGLILAGKTAGFASQWLCLYDKRARTAVVSEIEKP